MATITINAINANSKTCGKCGETKAISAFGIHHKKPRSSCKICHATSTREWYKNNKDKRREYYKKYAANNQEKLRKYRSKSVEKLSADPSWVAKRKAWHTNWRLKREYGITSEQWQSMFDAQKGLCALCKKRVHGRGNMLDVDHCHDTGRVRGLLCKHCNVALGILGDNPEKMERVMRYLRGD